MNVTINTQKLAQELRIVTKITTGKLPLPILSCVLLEATADGKLWLSTTDLEIGIKTVCPATVAMAGRIALPSSRLLSIIERLPNADVVLVGDVPQVAIASGKFSAQLSAMSVDDFPRLDDPQGVTSTIDQQSFQRLIARTRYAVANTDAQRLLRGALLKLQEGGGAMIATDGKRLAVTSVPRSGAAATVMIPIKTLDVLAAVVDADVELTLGERHLFFRIGDRLYTSRMMDGQFPNYEPIIPKGNDLKVTVDRGVLIDALQRVVLLAADDTHAITMTVDGTTLTLAASSAQAGSAKEEVPIQYTGTPVTLSAKGDHILDFLDVAASTYVVVALKDEKTSILLMDGDNHLGVIAVIR